jgi:hypothetical protein
MQMWGIGQQRDRGGVASLYEVPWYAILFEDLVANTLLRACNWPGLSILYRPTNWLLCSINNRYYRPILELPISNDQFRVVAPDLAFLLDDD